MNANTFRLIFSKRLGMRVPVAEQRSAQGKVASDKTAGRVLNPLAFSLTLLCVAPALALPVAPTVAHGSASFSQSGSTLTVTNTPNAIINWGSFSIGQNELTKFVQQSSASAVLNRVTGQSPSQILGQLQSNGRVFLINPNGIIFGQGARIDTAGLIASTLNLSDADFLAGKLRFSGTGSEAKVDNQGTINTAQGGFVYLIAPNVENSGLINAPNGDVLLAAGHSVEIADGLNPALRVVLTAPEGSVINLGQVLAESGRIGLHGGMVANSGVVSASSAVAEGGKIYLRATEKIELAEPSKLSANGTVGGEITAITQKDGLIAGELVARGEISAQGNGAAGSGGFVETSAANVMVDDGFKVSTRGGKWLIDPSDFTIAASGGNITGAALSNSLNNATSGGVTIFSSSGTAGGSGDINVNDTVSWSANTLTLTAARDININAVMTATGSAGLTMNTATTNSDDTGVSGGTVRVGFNPDGSFKGRVDMASSTALTINGSPYTLINDPTALQGMGGNLIGKYALGSNINASDTSNWNSGLGFDPIGNGLGAEFVGAFDGLGHTISGLTINRPAEDDIGLFGRVSGAQLRNVGLTGALIRGNRYVGGLAGQVEHTLINNAYADVTLAGDQYLGGLIGNINYSDLGIGTNTRIDRSHSSGSVTSLGTYFYYVGGLVGNVYSWLGDGNETYITHSYATTTLTTNNSLPTDLGGLVGTLGEYSTIADSYATGNINVTGSLDRVGGLVGVANSDTSITRSYASGNITGGPDSNQTGGLIGALSNFSSVSQVYATGAVTTGANSQNLGGLVGEMGQYSTISNSYATGDVTAGDYGSTLGGLVGYNNSYFDGSISNSYATGAVSSGISSDQIGGLVGDHNGSLIESSYATGSVTAGTNSDGVGGLVGYQTYVSPIKYSYATGKVTTGSGTTRAGGLVGAGCSLTSTCSITSSYWDVDSTGRIDGVGSYPTNPGISGIYSATPTVNAYDQAIYAGFDFATTWWMSESNTRPFLRMEWSNTITNAHQLQLMAISPSANYTLANNIDLAPALNAVSGLYPGMWGSAGFAPIGDATSGPFTGSFDGLDHTISGLTINRPGSNYVGLFGSTNNALISNIRLTSVSVAGLSYVGSLVGNSTGTNSSITNSYATGSVSGSANYVGGLVGWSDADISSSHAAVNVSATVNPMFVGGLVGIASANGSIEKSYASGSVVAGGSSTIYAGGLVGQSVTTLNESYATGSVTLANFSNNALIYAGGLTGSSMGTTAGISTSYATGNVSIASSDANPSYEYIYAGGLAGSNTNGSAIGNSYSTGNVTVQASSQTTESGAYLGGLVGWHGGNSTSSIDNSYSAGAITAGGTHVALGIGGLIGIRTGTNTVTSSYWNLDTAGTALAVGSGTDIIGSGLSTAQMQLQASFSNWDFSTVWNIDAGSSVSYPYLRNPEQIPHPGLSGGITTCDVCSWDGGGGNNYLWSLSTNWANNLLPAAASTVTIGSGYGTILFDINNLSLAALTASSALDIQNSNTLTLTGSATFNALVTGSGTLNIAGATVNANASTINVANLNFSAGSLTGTGNLTVSNHFNWTGGTLGSNFQNLSLAKQGDFSIGGISAVGNITLDAQAGGDLTLTGDVNKTGASAATLSLIADGTVVVDNGVALVMAGSGNAMAFTAPGGVTNNGTISPGGAGQIGTLNVTGNLTLGANSLLNIDLGGIGVGQSDKVNVTGNVTMAGALNRSLVGGYTPGLGDAIPFFAASGSSSGTFSIIDRLSNLVTGYRLAPGEAARQVFSGTGYNTFTNFVGGLTWETPGNWSVGSIPIATQTAIVTSSPLSPVTHKIGTDSILGLLISAGNALNITGGSLAVADTTSVGGTLNLTGGTYANNGMLNVTSTGIFNLAGGTLSGSGSMNNAGTMSLANQTITNAITNSGTVNSGGGLTFTQLFTNQGTFNANSGMSTFSNGLSQSAGNLMLGGGNVTGNLTLNGGSLKGAGTMTGNVSVGAATLAPGSSPGTLNITGNLTLSSSSTTAIELWGTTAGQFDVINVSGSASLAGALNATTGNGYVPGIGHALRFMTFASSTGSFGSTSLPSGMSLSALATALDLLGPTVPSSLPPGVSSSVNLLDNSLTLGAVNFETPLLYLAGQSSPTASSSGTLTQTAEIVLPDLMPEAPAAGDIGDDANNGSAVASVIPMFDQLVRDAIFKDAPHDSRLICR